MQFHSEILVLESPINIKSPKVHASKYLTQTFVRRKLYAIG